MTELSDTELLAELGVDVENNKAVKFTPSQERIIAGFEEILRFVDENNRVPIEGTDKDIFERLYAVRLSRIRQDDNMRELVLPLDKQGLLAGSNEDTELPESMDDKELLSELGIDVDDDGLANLTHVRSHSERKAAEEIAGREKCEDFDRFKSLFERIQLDLTNGVRTTRPFRDDATIEVGHWFIVDGLKALVAAANEEFIGEYGTRRHKNQRLRVIFENGTESRLLKRSLERALQKDPRGRRITDPSMGPLFADAAGNEDVQTGIIYVLRSKSTNPFVLEHQQVIHKIGVTTQSVGSRIANAAKSSTFLMADVEVMGTFTLFNIAPQKFENLLHKVFDNARLDVIAADAYGNEVSAREWFVVPFDAITEAVDRIIDGSITKYRYDAGKASLLPASNIQ